MKNKKIVITDYYKEDDARAMANYMVDNIIKHGYDFVKVSSEKPSFVRAFYLLKKIFLSKNSEFIIFYPGLASPGSKPIISLIIYLITSITRCINYFHKNVVKIIVLDMVIKQYDFKGLSKFFADLAQKHIFKLSKYIYVPLDTYKDYIDMRFHNKLVYMGLPLERHNISITKEKTKDDKFKICIAGNLHKDRMYEIISKLPKKDEIIYNFYGIFGDWIEELGRKDFLYNGVLQYSELHQKISENNAGLVAYSYNQHEYFKVAIPAKLVTYLNSCIPVITLKDYKTSVYYVEKLSAGICIDTIEDIANIDFSYLRELVIPPNIVGTESFYNKFTAMK